MPLDEDKKAKSRVLGIVVVFVTLLGGLVAMLHANATKRLASVSDAERIAATKELDRFRNALPGAFIILKNGRVGIKIDVSALAWCESGKRKIIKLHNRIGYSYWVPITKRAIEPFEPEYVEFYRNCKKT